MAHPHIVVDITGHGYGHAAMTLPVIDALAALRPGLRLTVRSSLEEAWLRARTSAPFAYRANDELGMAMEDGLRVKAPESLAHYAAIHGDWNGAVAREAAELAPLRADLLVSNIGYLSLAAARHIGIDRVAYSSLNWADVFWGYCGHLPGADRIMSQMVDAYAAADTFIQPTPSMPMPSIRNGLPTAPVVRIGRDRRAEIARRLNLGQDVRLAVISLGGIETPLTYSTWPRLAGWRVVSGSQDRPDHPDVVSWTCLDMPFIDVLASADVLVIKPGYGLITEAVCNGKRALYVPRPGWPETEAQLAWMAQYGCGRPILERDLRTGHFLEEVGDLLSQSLPSPPAAEGARDIARILLGRLKV